MAWFKRAPDRNKIRDTLKLMIEEVIAYAEARQMPLPLLFAFLRDDPFRFPQSGHYFAKPERQQRFEELRASLGDRKQLEAIEPLAREIMAELVAADPRLSFGQKSAGPAAGRDSFREKVTSEGLILEEMMEFDEGDTVLEGLSRLEGGGAELGRSAQASAGAGSGEEDTLLLGSEKAAAEPEAAGEPTPLPPKPERRWLTAGIIDHDGVSPLHLTRPYFLEFGISLEKSGALGNAAIPDASLLYADEEDEIELTIQLDSPDFQISEPTKTLRLPRRGPSKDKPVFVITALHAGSGTIIATLHKAGNFLQQLELTLSVGAATTAPHTSETKGRSLEDAVVLAPREIGMSVSPAPATGYDLVIWGATSARVKLPITNDMLAQSVSNAREKLMQVIMRKSSGKYVFQDRVKIPEADSAWALEVLRDAGALLYQKLFYGPNAGADVNRVGHWLREQILGSSTPVQLQILSAEFPVPWPLLYLGEPTGPVNWDSFLGMRAIIEQIPLQPNLTTPDPTIASDSPSLLASVNVNGAIDAQMNATFVARQRDFWGEQSQALKFRLETRDKSVDFLAALTAPADDQLIYIFCHAESTGLGVSNGIDSSYIDLGDGRLALSDFQLKAPATKKLPGHPLVIINACESAELSPLFYDGFVPYFMSKGARGVIGTECKTPALFATEWALRFFPLFFGGRPVGDAILATRRDCMTEWNNPLGLLYAVHCNADTRVHPGLS